MRTSAAVAPLLVANTGFRSISEISGKSVISCETFWISDASASRSTAAAPRTPFSISAAAMPSSIDSASSRVAGARRNVMSFSTSTSIAAEAERDELAERWIGDGADDHFLAAGQHLLHLHAEKIRLRVVLLRVRHDRGEALLDLLARSSRRQ